MSSEDRFKSLFMQLRNEWFISHLESHPPERESESPEQELSRRIYNAKLRARFNLETEEIICGKDRAIAPKCVYDMDLFKD